MTEALSHFAGASRRLKFAATVAVVLDVLLGLNILGYQFLGSIGSPDQFGLESLEILLFVPLAIPFALAALIAPPILVARHLESSASAWLLIGLVAVGGAISAAQVGWHSLGQERSHDRELRAVRSLAGLHGEHDGVRFEIRPVAGEGMIDLRVNVEHAAAAPELTPEHWLYVMCESKDVQAQFGNDASRLNMYGGPPSRVRETPEGAVFQFQHSSPHADYEPDSRDPFCAFVVYDTAAGIPRTIYQAPLQR